MPEGEGREVGGESGEDEGEDETEEEDEEGVGDGAVDGGEEKEAECGEGPETVVSPGGGEPGKVAEERVAGGNDEGEAGADLDSFDDGDGDGVGEAREEAGYAE